MKICISLAILSLIIIMIGCQNPADWYNEPDIPVKTADSILILFQNDTLNINIHSGIPTSQLIIDTTLDSININDSIKLIFYLSGERHEKDPESPQKRFFWGNDTIDIWFVFVGNTIENDSVGENGVVLPKISMQPSPESYVKIDSIQLFHSIYKNVNIEIK